MTKISFLLLLPASTKNKVLQQQLHPEQKIRVSKIAKFKHWNLSSEKIHVGGLGNHTTICFSDHQIVLPLVAKVLNLGVYIGIATNQLP